MKVEKPEKLLQEAQKAQAINLAGPLLFPYLQEIMEQTITEAVHAFKSGKTDLVAYVARMATIKDMESEFLELQSRGNRAHEKLVKLKED